MATEAQWASYRAWLKDAVLLDQKTVTPLYLMWRSYTAFCAEYGFNRAGVVDFAEWMADEEQFRVKDLEASRIVVGATSLVLAICPVRYGT